MSNLSKERYVSKMKILVILNYYYPYVSGVSEYARLLCNELVARGNDVTVLTSQHDSKLLENETINGVKVIRAPIWFKLSKGIVSPKFVRWTVKYAKCADMLWLHLPMLESGIITSLLPKQKIVCTYHCDINLPKGMLNSFIVCVMDMCHRIALARTRYIVVNTIEYMKTSRIACKYIGKMREISPPIKRLPKTKRIKHDGFIIGFCGRIVGEKGLDILIKAFELLQKENENIKLVIGGDYETVAGGSIYSELIEYIERHNISNIQFIGKISEDKMAEFYSSLDVLVLPSTNSLESFGMVQVEAMTCGTPVIASDLPGVRTVVQKTGMGLICKKSDVADLKRCIGLIMDDYGSYVRERTYIESFYSIEKSVEQYMEVFSK